MSWVAVQILTESLAIYLDSETRNIVCAEFSCPHSRCCPSCPSNGCGSLDPLLLILHTRNEQIFFLATFSDALQSSSSFSPTSAEQLKNKQFTLCFYLFLSASSAPESICQPSFSRAFKGLSVYIAVRCSKIRIHQELFSYSRSRC